MFRLILLFLFAFLADIKNSQAQSIINIDREKETLNIGKQIATYVDSTDLLTYNQVSAQPFQSNFKLSNQHSPNFGSTLLPVWCKFIVSNNTTQKLILGIDNSQIEWLDLFVSKNGIVDQKSISAYEPFNNRQFLLNKAFFGLSLPKDSVYTYYLRLETLTGLQFPITIYTQEALLESEQSKNLIYGIYIGIMIIMILYNLLIYFSIRSLSYLLYVLYITFMMLTNLIDKGLAFEFLWPQVPGINHYINIIGCGTGIFAILFSISFLRIYRFSKRLHKILKAIILFYIVTIFVILFKERYLGLIMTEIISVIASLLLFSSGIIIYRKGFKPALYYLFGWSFLLVGVNILILKDFGVVPFNNFTSNGMILGSAIEALLLSLALGSRINLLKKEKEKANIKALRSMDEQRKLIHDQNIMLEKKVEERTIALKQSNQELTDALQNLKDAEAQLIQSEKMASLGELTAGIAHEIQNPLNFVNNFSEVNREMIAEMKEEIDKGNYEEVKGIAKDIEANEEKINHHGKRADAIVKGMLQHSRSSSGTKEPTDINALCDEYLRLSYHGLRAKDKSFNATLKTDFDETIGNINIIPQDIGRVMLNLINNAFYAVDEKKKSGAENYEPVVTVCTKSLKPPSGGLGVLISVADNGNGIPQPILDKIFQPFFTTKPTGQGTGLGLSLSYDIIKAHGGELIVETKEGEGTLFRIKLPS